MAFVINLLTITNGAFHLGWTVLHRANTKHRQTSLRETIDNGPPMSMKLPGTYTPGLPCLYNHINLKIIYWSGQSGLMPFGISRRNCEIWHPLFLFFGSQETTHWSYYPEPSLKIIHIANMISLLLLWRTKVRFLIYETEHYRQFYDTCHPFCLTTQNEFVMGVEQVVNALHADFWKEGSIFGVLGCEEVLSGI